MTFRVVLSSVARRDLLHSLPPPAAAACGLLLAGALADNPRWVGTPLREPFVGHWVARRGEYRIRYRIDETTHTVFVVAIRHRRDAYRA